MRNPSWGPRNNQRPKILQIFTNWVSFPATQVASSDPNTLDDYEEGAWTPTDGSGAGLTLTVNAARYTKVGGLVVVECFVTYPATASGASAAISGLPFAAAGVTVGTVLTNGAGGATVVQISASSAQILAPGAVAVTNANLSGKNVVMGASFRVA